MKKHLFMSVLFLSCALSALSAQEQKQAGNEQANRFSVGYGVSRYQDDFAVGLVVTSPYFARNRVAIQARGAGAWLAGTPENESKETWLPYAHFGLDIIGVGASLCDCVRLYGKGGIVVLVPNSEFSSGVHFGGAGSFGFEFIPFVKRCLTTYFIELGGIGIGKRAEKIQNQPFYSNGFLMSTGLKHYF